MLPWLGLSRATADCPTYRIIDLGSLRTSAGGTSDAFAVNDANQVVGQSNTDVPAALHAFFWDNAGCTGNCMSDLGTLIGGTDSVAYDINNDMEIAGQSETINQQQLVFRATYWSSPMATPLDLGTLGTDVDDDSGAFGINEHSTIVGWTDTDTTCPNEPAVDLSVAFRMQPTGAMTVLHPDGGYGGSDNYDAVAVAINTPPQPPAYGFLPDIAGIGSPCGASPDFCGVPETTDSQVWEENDETATDLSEPPGFGDGRGEARDVNTADELVGWAPSRAAPASSVRCSGHPLPVRRTTSMNLRGSQTTLRFPPLTILAPRR
jgi:probable HAF family extracellular repeat protein